jgi:hypothetical protein
LPESVGLERDLRSKIRHVDNKPLDEKDLSEYDNHTVFYDVFFNVGNSRLYLLGPPLLNLRKALLPLSVKLNGIKVSLSINEYFKKRYVEICAEVPPDSVRTVNRVELDFNGVFDVALNVEWNQQQRHTRILTTLQKNNRPTWIKEWVRYYQTCFDIDAVVLYDNGSENIQQLREELDGVIIEDWNYPYGVISSHDNKFCQYGSLNHCRLKYGCGSVIFNFDIDEILCVDSVWLNQQLQRFDVLYFDSYSVPFTRIDVENYTFGDFSKRNRYSRKSAKKYIYHDASVIANNVHYTRNVKSEFLNKIQAEIIRLLRKMMKIRLFSKLAVFLIESISKTRQVELHEGYFLHYDGITTNWKSIYHNRLGQESDSVNLVDINPSYLARIREISSSQ